MAPIESSAHDIPSDDDLAAILNGTVDGQDIFDTSNIQAQIQPPKNQNPPDDDVLGLKEIDVAKKKRQPIPKLDENRILSDPGIPKLRRISKERLKFKGKGHEYGDIARMLNMYQLWLDDLYPRAKFADGLTMIEKLGHTKRIQLMRKEWIDEGKPRRSTESNDEEADAGILERTQESGAEPMDGIEAIDTTGEGEVPERDPLDTELGSRTSENDEPEEDELDALLAEDAVLENSMTSAIPPPKAVPAGGADLFADDMEAMAEIEGMW